MNKKHSLLSLTLLLLSNIGLANAPLQTVKNVDLKRYAGRWYEIASIPNRFQKGCRCTMATYTLSGPNRIDILNQCLKPDNSVDTARGKAWAADTSNTGKLSVQFFWPFRGKYWILALDKHYRYAMVGAPSRDYLWILSRRKTLSSKDYNALLSNATQQGFDVKRLRKTDQSCR